MITSQPQVPAQRDEQFPLQPKEIGQQHIYAESLLIHVEIDKAHTFFILLIKPHVSGENGVIQLPRLELDEEIAEHDEQIAEHNEEIIEHEEEISVVLHF